MCTCWGGGDFGTVASNVCFKLCAAGCGRFTRRLNLLWYTELKSVVAVQCTWRSLHPGEKPPTDKALNRWINQFKETGTVEKKKSTGRPRTSEDVERIRQCCTRSPKKSIARRSVISGIQTTTTQNVLHKRLRLHAYKIQLKQENKPDNRPKRVEFATSCSTPLIKTKPSYGAFVSRTRQHFM